MYMASAIFYTIELIGKQNVAERIVILRFTKPTGFSFVPGQFVQVRVPDGDALLLRSYSLSSTPVDPYLELCVKILSGGKASALLDSLQIGEQIEISEPRGFFVIQPEHAKRKIFIATGTGIAPIMSMIEGSHGSEGTTTLLFGVRTEEDLFWTERFEKIKHNQSGFDSAVTLSQPSSGWTGKKGRVTEHLPIELSAEYYICGNAEMVKDVRHLLLADGVNTKSIHLEIF